MPQRTHTRVLWRSLWVLWYLNFTTLTPDINIIPVKKPAEKVGKILINILRSITCKTNKLGHKKKTDYKIFKWRKKKRENIAKKFFMIIWTPDKMWEKKLLGIIGQWNRLQKFSYKLVIDEIPQNKNGGWLKFYRGKLQKINFQVSKRQRL